jgi:hypothetical protein
VVEEAKNTFIYSGNNTASIGSWTGNGKRKTTEGIRDDVIKT